MMNFGLGVDMGNISRLSNAKTRSICAENPTGEKGKGGMALEGPGSYCAKHLGHGWKISPYIVIKPGETAVLADIKDAGAIQHIWMTATGIWRQTILRMYWDNQENPSVETPLGDFFAEAYQGSFRQITSLPVCVNPGSAFNCYWEMPFRERALITVENCTDKEMLLFYQVDYVLSDVPDDCAYFHAQFRRVNPLPYKEVYTIVDGIKGKGHYVGTYMAWGVNNNGWWGEGEIKFYMDGDDEYPTICGTGTEDYFCGSYNFDVHGQYTEYTTPYCGLSKVLRPDGLYQSQQRFSMYRWHIPDPIRFEEDLRITIQALGLRSSDGTYLALQDDISSVAFWYQTLPFQKFPELPDREFLEII